MKENLLIDYRKYFICFIVFIISFLIIGINNVHAEQSANTNNWPNNLPKGTRYFIAQTSDDKYMAFVDWRSHGEEGGKDGGFIVLNSSKYYEKSKYGWELINNEKDYKIAIDKEKAEKLYKGWFTNDNIIYEKLNLYKKSRNTNIIVSFNPPKFPLVQVKKMEVKELVKAITKQVNQILPIAIVVFSLILGISLVRYLVIRFL